MTRSKSPLRKRVHVRRDPVHVHGEKLVTTFSIVIPFGRGALAARLLAREIEEFLRSRERSPETT